MTEVCDFFVLLKTCEETCPEINEGPCRKIGGMIYPKTFEETCQRTFEKTCQRTFEKTCQRTFEESPQPVRLETHSVDGVERYQTIEVMSP